jgi:hypothetical protein
VITKNYKTLWDVVGDFDLDSCCIAAVQTGVTLTCYTNNRGRYAIDNMLNHFNPDKYQIAYPSRMVKYYSRGFKIYLPSLVPINVNDLDILIRMASKNYVFPISWLDSTSDTHIIASMLPSNKCETIQQYIIDNYSYNLPLVEYNSEFSRDKFYSSDKKFFSMPNWLNDVFGDKIKLATPSDLYIMAKY